MAKQKYYAYYISEGKDKGIVTSWDICKNAVAGKQARYKSFESESEAKKWLDSGAKYEPNPELQKKNAEKKLKNNLAKENLPDEIFFDSGTGRGIGTEIRVTDLAGGSYLEIFYPDKVNKFGNIALGKERTNNFGELAALYYALSIAVKTGKKKIFGDSNLVIYFWSEGRYNKDGLSEETINLIQEVVKRKKAFEKMGGTVEFISGDINPADLGFHK